VVLDFRASLLKIDGFDCLGAGVGVGEEGEEEEEDEEEEEEEEEEAEEEYEVELGEPGEGGLVGDRTENNCDNFESKADIFCSN